MAIWLVNVFLNHALDYVQLNIVILVKTILRTRTNIIVLTAKRSYLLLNFIQSSALSAEERVSVFRPL